MEGVRIYVLGISRKINGTEQPQAPAKCWHYPLGKIPVVFDNSKSVFLIQADFSQWAVSLGEVSRKGILAEVRESLGL